MSETNGTVPSGAPTPPAEAGSAQQPAGTQTGYGQPAAESQSSSQNWQAGHQPTGQPAQGYHYQQPVQPQPPQSQFRAAQPQQPQQPQPAAPAHFAAGGQASKQKEKQTGARTFLLGFAGALVACVLAFAGFGIYNMAVNPGASTSDSGAQTQLGAQSSTSTSGSQDESLTLAESVAKKCLPSVAAIDVYASQSSLGGYGYGYGYMYGNSGQGDTLTQSSLGSGVVLTSDGYVITNYHVIEGGQAYKVTIEGETYDAEVVGSDPSSDVAVIKAQGASGLTAVEIGDSDNLTIGEWVMSIGSPFGLEQSVATGIVSATSRSQIMDSSTDMYGNSTGETTIYPNMIQTDAAINPGNSGGALVDADGKLIGINTLITSYSGNYSGVGFAIPVNYAVNIAQQIIDGKTPTHAQLGVSLSSVNSQMAQRYGLAVDSGAYVAAVQSGSGAADAGLQPGDIIVAFDGATVDSASDLMLDVRAKNPGDKVKMTVNRSGETMEVEVTLGSDESSASASTQQQSQESSSLLERLFGGGSSAQGNAA